MIGSSSPLSLARSTYVPPVSAPPSISIPSFAQLSYGFNVEAAAVIGYPFDDGPQQYSAGVRISAGEIVFPDGSGALYASRGAFATAIDSSGNPLLQAHTGDFPGRAVGAYAGVGLSALISNARNMEEFGAISVTHTLEFGRAERMYSIQFGEGPNGLFSVALGSPSFPGVGYGGEISTVPSTTKPIYNFPSPWRR